MCDPYIQSTKSRKSPRYKVIPNLLIYSQNKAENDDYNRAIQQKKAQSGPEGFWNGLILLTMEYGIRNNEYHAEPPVPLSPISQCRAFPPRI